MEGRLMREIYYIKTTLNTILQDSKRSEIKIIQGYLCNEILQKWNIYVDNYKNFKAFEKYKNIAEFLAFIFDIESNKMESILQKLDIYKNYKITELNARIDCLSVKL